MQTNSTRSPIFNSTSTDSTSTPKPFSKELEMSTSTEDPELSSRVSKYLIGPPLRRDTAGNSTPTQDKLGKTPCTTSTLNGLLLNSQEKDKSQTLLNGSDLSNGERVTLQDFSTMKYPSQPG